MKLERGQVAVVTGASSGIGLAMAHRFAQAGMNIVLADVDEPGLAAAAASIEALGVETLTRRTDVRHAEELDALAAATIERFGSVHVLCNNAGVASFGDSWGGPIESWKWVLDVNMYGVIHGIRAFLPHMVFTGGHIVNTASIAGLFPGFSGPYDASKHAVVAITEGLYHQMQMIGGLVGVSCLCPGWVRTGIAQAERNWPADMGELPAASIPAEMSRGYLERAIDEGTTPASVADMVAESIEESRFWVFPHQDFLEMCIERWHLIAERHNPVEPEQMPGMPPRAQMIAEVLAALGMAPPAEPSE
jgi:NAD(P)-dependent dehydrogenase (short-subunit alcohol dehydrogenase family)